MHTKIAFALLLTSIVLPPVRLVGPWIVLLQFGLMVLALLVFWIGGIVERHRARIAFRRELDDYVSPWGPRR